MDNSLMVMIGILRGDNPISEDWKEQVETLKSEAIPVVAVRRDPFPAVLLDVEKRPDVLDLIDTLRSEGDAPEHWVVWCTLLTPDLSIAESFLLVSITKPIECRFTLRFHLIRHQTVLEAIEQTSKLAIFADSNKELVFVNVNVPDLREHLAQLRIFQKKRAEEGEQGDERKI